MSINARPPTSCASLPELVAGFSSQKTLVAAPFDLHTGMTAFALQVRVGRLVHCSFGGGGGGASLWICVLLIISLLGMGSNIGAELSRDGRALLKLLEQNRGLLEKCPEVASWNASEDTPCGWLRVSCTPDSAVRRLDFSACFISADLAKDVLDLTMLSDLRSLQELDLSSNPQLSFNSTDRELFTGLTWLDISGSYGGGENSPDPDPDPSRTALPKLQYLKAEGTVGAINWFVNLKGLENLVALSFANNGLPDEHYDVPTLKGSIPEEVRDLTKLASLDLSGNYFTGTIPNLEGLTRLTQLYVSRNNLSGDVPAAPNLKYMDAAENRFTNLTDSFFKICAESLVQVNLSRNQLGGQLPDNIGELNSLQVLDMSWNRLQGHIPSGLRNVTHLDLSNNTLSGPIPQDIGNNIYTDEDQGWDTWVDLSGNQLNGSIPASVLYGAVYVNLSRNSLVGNIPETPWSMTNRFHPSFLDLSDNQLDGSLPSSFSSHFPQLLWLQNNSFSGDFIDFLIEANTGTASSTRVQGNRFTGDLTKLLDSRTLERLGGLTILDLGHNFFNMTPSNDTELFPNPLGNMLEGLCNSTFYNSSDPSEKGSYFMELRLASNDLMGQQLPATFSCDNPKGLESLQILDLGSCNLTGPLPNFGIFNRSMPNLAFLNVSNNRLSGPIPRQLPDTLSVLDLGNNNLVSQTGMSSELESGMPFELFTGLPNLVHFNASNNNLSGAIPGTFSRTLQVLDLSNNSLTGDIPGSLFFGLTALEYINLSGNNLKGTIPEGLPPDVFKASSFAGNPGLCGGPLPPCAAHGHGVVMPVWLLVTLVLAVVLVCTGSCFLLVWRWRVYSKKHQQDADLIATLLERETVTVMPLRQLRRATSNFSESAQIGVGGFGTVYTGRLPDGTKVAIKKGKREDSPEYKQQFLNEVRILSGVKHRHLVKLLGCSMENKIALLVFEFVPNGTLLEHLQGKRQGFSPLTWRQRLLIALQTSDALAYLHSAADPPIFHRDVKSSNILLDHDLNAKVADFGISKLAPNKAATHVSTVAVQGTMGYIDPEYYVSFQLTPKSDVYSFGVVLLELISAKPAVDFQRGYDEASLANLAFSAMDKGSWEGLIDPVLADTYTSASGKASIDSVGALAVRCLALKSRDRPDMREVRKVLQTDWLHWDSDASDDVSHDLQAQHAYCGVHACPQQSSQSSQYSSSTTSGPEIEMSSLLSNMIGASCR